MRGAIFKKVFTGAFLSKYSTLHFKIQTSSNIAYTSVGGNNKCAHGNLDECYGLGIDQSTSARSLHQAAKPVSGPGKSDSTFS